MLQFFTSAKMVQSAVKRHADPQMVLGLWNACASLKLQKQIATAEKIQTFMFDEYSEYWVLCVCIPESIWVMNQSYSDIYVYSSISMNVF